VEIKENLIPEPRIHPSQHAHGFGGESCGWFSCRIHELWSGYVVKSDQRFSKQKKFKDRVNNKSC